GLPEQGRRAALVGAVCPSGRAVARRSGSCTSGHSGRPVCTAARGPVSAAAETASPPDYPREPLGCQASLPLPPSARQRARTAAAPLPHQSAPLGAQRYAPAPLRSARALAPV